MIRGLLNLCSPYILSTKVFVDIFLGHKLDGLIGLFKVSFSTNRYPSLSGTKTPTCPTGVAIKIVVDNDRKHPSLLFDRTVWYSSHLLGVDFLHLGSLQSWNWKQDVKFFTYPWHQRACPCQWKMLSMNKEFVSLTLFGDFDAIFSINKVLIDNLF